MIHDEKTLCSPQKLILMIFKLVKMKIKKKENKCNIKKQNFKTEKNGNKTNRKKGTKREKTLKKWTCPFAFILLFRCAFLFCFYFPFCFAFFPVKSKLNAK